MSLSFLDISLLFPGGHRAIIEGEAVFRANHIVLCGVIKSTDIFCEIMALCLKTSDLRGLPHELRIKINKSAEGEKILKAHCSCKAGAGGRCKHIAATLLYIFINGFEKLEELSCTEVQQSWGKVKESVKEMYEDVAISEMCHVKNAKSHYLPSMVDESQANTIAMSLISLSGDTEANLHRKGRRQVVDDGYDPTSLLERSLAVALLARRPNVRQSPFYFGMSRAMRSYYASNVVMTEDAAVSLLLRHQGSPQWTNERRVRITASNAYGLSTYLSNTKADWHKKLNSTLRSSFRGNPATMHGLKWEGPARECLMAEEDCLVEEVGLLVQPSLPWLGCSPDGIIWPNILVEIKCPTAGKKSNVDSILPGCKFLIETANGYDLKRKHSFYGQVQVGMLLTGCEKCYFIVFASYDSSYKKIEVLYDEAFTSDLISKLKRVYFQNLLPILCSNQV